MAGPVVRSPAKRPRFTRATAAALQSTDYTDVSPPRDKSPSYPPPSPTAPFKGWTPAQMAPERTRTHYSTDEEEFGEVRELERGYWEPPSCIITPTKRKRL